MLTAYQNLQLIRAHLDPKRRPLLEAAEMIRQGNFSGACAHLVPDDPLRGLQILWMHLGSVRAAALVAAVQNNHARATHDDFLQRALEDIATADPVFDLEEDAKVFRALPEEIDVFRGTGESELASEKWGFWWTPERPYTSAFARENSDPVILRARVTTARIRYLGLAGLEVIVGRRDLRDVQRVETWRVPGTNILL